MVKFISLSISSVALTLITVVGTPLCTLANTGVFYGAGSRVIPIRNTDIQLVRENVDIVLSVDKNLGNSGLVFTPWANVRAIFHFVNSSDQPVDLQVGFPVESQPSTIEYSLQHLTFRVVSDGKPVRTVAKTSSESKEFDPEGRFGTVMTWNEHFNPEQSKAINVSYKILMSAALDTVSPQLLEYDKLPKDEKKLESIAKVIESVPTIRYLFNYITATAKTWKEPVSEAVFRLDTSEIDNFVQQDNFQFFDNRGDSPKVMSPLVLKCVGSWSGCMGIKKNPFDQVTATAGGNGTYKWTFYQNIPDDGFSVQYLATSLPSNPADVKIHFQRLLVQTDGIAENELISMMRMFYCRAAYGKLPPDTFTNSYFKEDENYPWTIVGKEQQTNAEMICRDYQRLVVK